jgi:hypothetical protein
MKNRHADEIKCNALLEGATAEIPPEGSDAQDGDENDR